MFVNLHANRLPRPGQSLNVVNNFYTLNIIFHISELKLCFERIPVCLFGFMKHCTIYIRLHNVEPCSIPRHDSLKQKKNYVNVYFSVKSFALQISLNPFSCIKRRVNGCLLLSWWISRKVFIVLLCKSFRG